jgi:serine/threonine-protein kinase HipA
LRDHRKISARSTIDMLSMMNGATIGALSITIAGLEPVFSLGANVAELTQTEAAARQLDDIGHERLTLEQAALLYLANSGSGVGGARPKALVYDQNGAYLAKFNRAPGPQGDAYNNARVELACLKMANAAGIHCPAARVEPGVNGREVLLVNRFDVNQDGSRNHLITINGLLKDQRTQADIGEAFSYDHIHGLIQRHSVAIEHDLNQLLRRMLFNRAIHNVDDHERNFSLINDGDGYRLSPAYDMVPSLIFGAYHAAAYGTQPLPPTPQQAMNLRRVFGLSRGEITACAEQVQAAVENWPQYAAQAGVSEEDAERVSAVLQIH